MEWSGIPNAVRCMYFGLEPSTLWRGLKLPFFPQCKGMHDSMCLFVGIGHGHGKWAMRGERKEALLLLLRSSRAKEMLITLCETETEREQQASHSV